MRESHTGAGQEAYNRRMFARVRTLFRLSPSDRRLILAVAIVLPAVRLGLRLLPVHTVRTLMARLIGRRPAAATSEPGYPERVGWAVRAVAPDLGASCLPQALTAALLLERRGHPVTLTIGVRRDENNRFAGHAWVECDGRIVVGGGDLSAYTPIPVFADRAS